MPGNFEKRLAKIEEVLAKKVEEEYLSKCNCGDPKGIFMLLPEVNAAVQLTEELALKCPIHQERRLSRLIWFVVVDSDGAHIPDPEVDPLVEEYGRRYDQQLEQAAANAHENV
jgi:hypothetical protein